MSPLRRSSQLVTECPEALLIGTTTKAFEITAMQNAEFHGSTVIINCLAKFAAVNTRVVP